MPEGMAEATKLTNAGRLMEATELIQRTLGNPGGAGGVSPGSRCNRPESGADEHRSSGNSATREKANFDYLKNAFASSRGGKLFDFPQELRDLPADVPGIPRIRVPEAPTVDVPEGGRFVSGSFSNAAGTRGYKLYIPSGIEGENVPLVVMLHGCTQNPDDFAAGTRMNVLAEEGKSFVVYPEQSQGANMQKCWNWFQAGDQIRDRGEPSIIAGITHQIAATQPVDTRRVYVAGMSAGAAMAVVMGETYPDLYAAVGVHSGLPYGVARDMPSAFQAMQRGGAARAATSSAPTIVFHGDRDTTVSRRNGEQILKRWVSPDATTGEGTNGKPLVTVKKGQVPGGHAYTRSVYHDAEGRAVAEGWMVHEAGHAWSGGDQRGSYTDSLGPDASAEMVRFFLEHPRR
jgi:poly(hydroxyalkanoate) depolymerase family esterase